MTKEKIVTRFAPSPTGSLHIGGARTCLFNWAYAKHCGGQMILRIEDTDQARSTEQSAKEIIRDLAWLGLDWQQGPYFQSQRLDIYEKYIQQLIETKQAYKCFKTREELTSLRDKARQDGLNYKYDNTDSLGLKKKQIEENEKNGVPYVVRFKMPDRNIVFQDRVLGRIVVQKEELEDFVIMKSDGFPTYHLAVVVDDALMGTSVLIRAQEHLNNTHKHVALQSALKFKKPKYVHIPLIFNPNGSKMSKRDKAKVTRDFTKKWLKEKEISEGAFGEALGVDITSFMKNKSDDMNVINPIAKALEIPLPEIDVYDFRMNGYLPEVLLNYIALLGWSPGKNIEKFDMDFLIEKFDLTRIGKSNACFNRDKLDNFNAAAIRDMPIKQFDQLLREYCIQFKKEFVEKMGSNRFRMFAVAYHQRCKTFLDACNMGKFIVQEAEEIEYINKAVKKHLLKNNMLGIIVLKQIRESLFATPWLRDKINATLKMYGTKSYQAIRIALTGNSVSPSMCDTLMLLSKDEAIKRIDRCLDKFDK